MKFKLLFGFGGVAAAAVGAGLLVPMASQAQAPIDNEALFNGHCKACHEPALDRAPTRTDMAQRSANDLLQVLVNGPMQPMTAGMKPEEVRSLATYLSRERAGGNPLSAGAAPAAAGGAGQGYGPQARGPVGPVAPTTDVMCSTHPAIKPGASDWTSWGIDNVNSRYQKNPGLKASDVPKLKVKWTMSIRGGAYSQPTVIGDWMFFVSRGGGFYAIDAKSGCVHWKLPDISSRTTPMIIKSPASPSGYMTVLGVANRQVKSFDLQNGKEIWTSDSLEEHKSAGISGSPIVYGNQVFVPLTSGEEGAGGQPTYSCCSFRGSVAALDLATGKKQWQTSVIPEPLRPHRKNAAGTQMVGPAGGAIWSAPTIDAKRGLVLVATGDSYTEIDTVGADAIVAMEMKTGKIKWSTQVTKDDNFIVSCTQIKKSVNCPNPSGPDYDFGSPPILFTLPNGKQVVLSGQKSSIAYGMDPDTGKVLWKTAIGAGGSLGGIEWGMAADNKRLYAANSDIIQIMDEYLRPRGQAVLSTPSPGAKPNLSAIDPATGKVLWTKPAPKAPCKYFGDRSRDRVPNGPCLNAQSAAVTVIPGAVFSGTTDGWFRAYDPATGKIIWEHSTTAQLYDTINGVKGQPGGGIDSMGATVANGMVYTFSGYGGSANTGGNPLNVLIAYSVDGK